MMKSFFLLLMLVTLTSFSPFYRTPKYIKLAERQMYAYSKYLAREKGLFQIGDGGAMMDDIKKIILAFETFRKFTIDETRQLYVEVVEEFLERINADEAIRPYLHNYPFTVDNLDISISFYEAPGHFVREGYVAGVFYVSGKGVFYEGFDPTARERKQPSLYDLHRESYAEAVEIARQNPPCPA